MNENNRQRRPAFDREQGIAIAQALFHQHGFRRGEPGRSDHAMNIKPPSFYPLRQQGGAIERAMRRYAGEARFFRQASGAGSTSCSSADCTID